MRDSEESKSIEQVIAEYVEAADAGQPQRAEEVLRRYPEYAEQLADFFQIHEHFEEATSEFKAPTRSSGSSAEFALNIENTSQSGPPAFIGEYEILEEINRGGMGVVYKAKDQKLGRVVALKLIRSGELASAEEKQRFLSEAEAAASLTHPGIVPIYNVGTIHGLAFYTMAFIEGRSLAEVVEEGAMDAEDALRVIHRLCAALEHAHRKGVFHRDLKPANVLIDSNGQPIIIDFGLAKMAHRDTSLTATGQILGTPAYIAPEHAMGQANQSGPVADVYATGAILYCLCTGRPPFVGPTPFDILVQVLDSYPPKPSKLNKRISKNVDHVCLRALAKEPAERYQSAPELADDLQRILTGVPLERVQENPLRRIHNWWRREPILVAHVAAIGVTTAIVAIAHYLRGEESTLFPYRMILLVSWILASLGLQYWVHRAARRGAAVVTWLAVDVAIYTTLITFADPPRSMLMIGYPMMVVASSLFYQRRFVICMTSLCVFGFLLLGWFFPLDDFVKPDFSAIFVTGLIVICLCMVAMINRVRGMSRFYEQPN